MALTLNQKIRSLTYFLTHPQAFKMILSFKESGYLYEVGWFRSLEEKKPVDKDGNPIPWFTYPAIEFINSRLSKKLKVFEFGSGNSSLYLSMRVSFVYSVEHDKNWFNTLSIVDDNLKLKLTSPDSPEIYTKPLEELDSKFDIIIIDGLYRNECIKKSIEYLSEKGIIILDYSEREEYKDGINHLISKNFNRLDFWGLAPIVFLKKCTSIFYYDTNCLGI